MQQGATDQPKHSPKVSSDRSGHVWGGDPEAEVPFLFEPRRRLPGAFGLSVVAHIAIFFGAIFLARVLPEPAAATSTPPPQNYDVVWLAEPGPGGGGGGGGNENPEPPREVQLPGKERITVPVLKAPELETPKPKDEPPPQQQLTIPAQMMASAEQTLPGVLEGLPTADVSSLGPGTGGGGGTGSGTGIGPGSGSGLGPGSGGGTGGGEYRPGSGVELPRVLREVKPQYTADAMRAKVQGTVWLEAVVLPDGSVGRVEITRSLDQVFGLDQEAVRAAKQWRFSPGTRFGQPVAVIVTIELTFTLR